MTFFPLGVRSLGVAMLLLALVGAAGAEDTGEPGDAPAYAQFFLGQFDVGREQADSQYGIEWLPGRYWTSYDIQSVIGLLRTRHGSHMVYVGPHRRTSFSRDGTGLALNVSFSPGLYLHGGSSDTDLGFPLQFFSSAGVDYELPDGTRIGLYFQHISNGSLSSENPGTELLTLKYGVTF